MITPKIKSGDQVIVLAGKNKGKKGKVMQIFPAERLVVVEGVNAMTKNIRSRKQGEAGQKIQFNAPIHLSNVMFVDPKTGKPSRLGATIVGGKKVRRVIRTKETVTA